MAAILKKDYAMITDKIEQMRKKTGRGRKADTLHDILLLLGNLELSHDDADMKNNIKFLDEIADLVSDLI